MPNSFRVAALAACVALLLPAISQAQDRVLFVNFGVYTNDGVNIYNELVGAMNTHDPGSIADYVLLPSNPGGAAALLATNTYDQVWVYDLSHGSDPWDADFQAIADWWLDDSGGELIADGRILSSFWGGRYPYEGRKLAENYFLNLHNEGGGLVLSTDHNVYANNGANDIAALIGVDPFTGIYWGSFPVDSANPLMSNPNVFTGLYNDSSTGQAPFGLQPNGIVLDAVGFHSGNPQTPGISSTIDGSLNMVLEITAPADGTVLCTGETVLATTSISGNTGTVSYVWSSDVDGVLGTGPTLVLDGSALSDGLHNITVLATDAGSGLVDDADVDVEIGGATCVVDSDGDGVGDDIDNCPDVPNGSTTGQSKIFINNDEWTLTNTGFAAAPDTPTYIANLADWFTGGGTGNFLAWSSNFGLAGSTLANTMANLGHSWTVSTSEPFTVANLQNYDAVFLGGNAVDQQVLIDYIAAGGNVYIMAGTGWGGPVNEANNWNTFLGFYGLGFRPSYNGVGGVFSVASAAHPVFDNVSALYSNNGNTVFQTTPINADTEGIVATGAGGGGFLFGVYDAAIDGLDGQQDIDGDGVGDACDACPTDPLDGCLDQDGDGFGPDEDCDDNDANNFPGNVEICDGQDNDCDGLPSGDEIDNDGDGLTECDGDCDDADGANFPGNGEVCDGQDNDCDGLLSGDELDDDSDGQTECDGDCDDADALNWDGNFEACDGQDNDCGGDIDEGYPDFDNDSIADCVDPDDDGDGIDDEDDECAETLVDDWDAGVPSRGSLGSNRWMYDIDLDVDGDGSFTQGSTGNGNNNGNGNGNNQSAGWTFEDTAGCSCAQIIDELELGNGHTKWGCSNSAMEDWNALVNP